uniref:Centrosomal protein 104 n=1 Tax=Cyprinus carpio TaxID=7962 RepID=A0A8C1VM99_CYPCA
CNKKLSYRMPHEIGFTVVSWSGHEGNYSAKKLMVHAPTVSGWRSTRFCPFPQEIILQLVERCRIWKLQLLAHQYLIPSKIKFHIGDRLPESISLSDNEKTGFRARELKSVHVDAVGSYLKFTFHRNHVNQYNSYNQVQRDSCGELGDCSLSKDQLIDQYLNNSQYSSALDGTHTGYECDSILPLNDLAFDMYQDPEVAHFIRLLDQKKQDMVREERFYLAKNLKQAIADLKKVGEHLGLYDVEKHSAIEREDHDTAKQKKEQLEAYRLTVYQQLELHDLLDISQIHRFSELSNSEFLSPRVGTQKHAPHPADSPRKRRQRQHVKETDEQDTLKAASPIHTVAPTSLTPPHVPKIDVFEVFDVHRINNAPPIDTTIPCSPGATGQPEPLTEKAQREASLPIDIFGDSLVRHSFTASRMLLLTVYKKLLEVPPGTPKAELRRMTRAAVFLCKKALTDKVSSVRELYLYFANEFIPNHLLGKSEISHCVEQTWNNLLSRTGESTLRLKTPAITFIQVTTTAAIQVIECDVFLAGGLEHIVQAMYGLHGKAVLNYLPPDDTTTRKNVLYKNLFDSLAKLNGNTINTRVKPVWRALLALSFMIKTLGMFIKSDDAGAVFSSLCIFCGERDESFTEDGLDLHYWKHCPMLQCCLQCRQVVEIASLTEHLLTECEQRANFTQCPLCSEALTRDKLIEHAQCASCNAPASGENCNHCPLCHENFASGEEVRSHTNIPTRCQSTSSTHLLSLKTK